MDLKHTTAVMDAVNEIPRPRLWAKVRNTVLGAAFLAGAYFGAAKWGWPWHPVLGLAMLGGFLVSQDLMRKAVSFGIGALKDILLAVRGAKEPPANG